MNNNPSKFNKIKRNGEGNIMSVETEQQTNQQPTEQKPVEQKKKQQRLSQTDFPSESFEKALRIAKALWEQYAGHPTPPQDIALASHMSPTSSTWRDITGAAYAYGLTGGSYSAKTIALTPLGKRIVAPTEEGDDIKAIREAVLKPRLMKAFFEKYERAKLPDTKIGENVLVTLGLPKERTAAAIKVILANGLFAGILKQAPTGGYLVSLDSPIPTSSPKNNDAADETPPSQGSDGGQPKGNAQPPQIHKQVQFGQGLYVNFEIHIAPETTVETIEAIFKNMRKYLIEND